MSKDYYRILGVLDDAEDVVIRAAYKALAQRYHPDKWTGNKDEANRRMQEINEAYAVLSDSAKRKQYDATRESKGYQDDADSEDSDSANFSSISEEQEAWNLAVQFFPTLDFYYTRLRKLDYYLANTFKTYLLENKNFNKASQISDKYAKNFLEKYFGTNAFIQEYAEELIVAKNKDAAKKLNEIVNVMGSSVSPIQIKEMVEAKFPNIKKSRYEQSEGHNNTQNIINRVKNQSASSNDLVILTEKVISGKVEVNYGLFSTSYSFKWTDGNEKSFDFVGFTTFVKEHVLSVIEGC
jgi:curved DNA-binding protein CbpA